MLGAGDSCWKTTSEEKFYILFPESVLCIAQGYVARIIRALELELYSAEGLRG